MSFIVKIIEYGLYLLVFLLPLQTRWIIKAGENEYLTISLYGTDILLIVLLFLFVIFKFQIQNFKSQINSKSKISNPKPRNIAARPRGRQITIYWFLIAGLELMVFISIFFASDKLVAVYRYGLFLLGVGLFWLIVSAHYNKIKLVYSLLAGIFLQACLGIWQFLTQSSFACKWLGLARHNAGDLGVSVVETISSIDGIAERWLRAYGGLDHPNVLGGVLVVGLLLFIWHSNLQSASWRIKFTNKFKSYKLITYYLLLITYISALFFTFSRGAWLGLTVGLAMMLFIAVVKKNLAVQKKILEIILISGILIFILFNQYQDLVMTRVSAGVRLEVKSSVERIESYKNSWELIKDNWLFGVGIGNYVKYNANLQINATTFTEATEVKNAANSNYANKDAFIQPVHNVFLLVWVEIGILGLLFFIGILLCVMRSTLCIPRYALLAALSVMFMVDHWWWSLHFGVLFFWLVLGLMLKKVDVENRR